LDYPQEKGGLPPVQESVAPKRQWPELFIRIEDETEAEALARHGLNEWPEDARFVYLSRADMELC
jgi:hypothetical protein